MIRIGPGTFDPFQQEVGYISVDTSILNGPRCKYHKMREGRSLR